MNFERLEKQLMFLREMDKAKSVIRNTLLLDSSRRENDAEHSWHMVVCAMLFTEYLNEPLTDMVRFFKMVLIHDAVEIYAGDTFAFASADELSSQHDRELVAADKLFPILPEDQANEFRSLWDEFEEQITPEAKCARMVDTFMPVYHNYMTKGAKWRELGATKEKVLKRCENIRNGSDVLYDFICKIIEDAVEKGYLPIS